MHYLFEIDIRRGWLLPKRTVVFAVSIFVPILCGMFATPAQTQQRTDPNQTEKNFEAFRGEQRRAKRSDIPLPKMAISEVKADTRPLFKLRAVSIEGVHVLSRDVIAQTFLSYIGKTVSQADLTAITAHITDLYRNEGYEFSRAIVPTQDIRGGRVRIRVIEGSIAEIVVKGEGSERFSIRSLLSPITAEQPARLKTLERQLLIVNDRAGVRVTDTALEEIGGTTGNFRLTVQVETWRIYAVLGVDNWGTPSIGPLQTYLATAFNSYFIPGDTLGVELSTIPDAARELRFGRLLYDMPIGINGARIAAVASNSEIRPSDERKLLDTRILTQTYELRASVLPLQTRLSSLRLAAIASWTDASETDSLGGNYTDHVRTIGLLADYMLQDNFGGSNYLTVGFRQGLNIFGASVKDNAFLSRSDASGEFSKLEFWFTRYQKLAEAWSIKFSAAGQWASRPLLESQEFYLGGPIFGRGYEGGELSGDNGIAGYAELRFDQEIKQQGLFKGYQLYSFVDSGRVWNIRDGKDGAFTLSSVGVGVRLYLPNDFQAGVGIAFPLDYRSPNNTRNDPRVFFSVSKAFKFCPGRIDIRCS